MSRLFKQGDKVRLKRSTITGIVTRDQHPTTHSVSVYVDGLTHSNRDTYGNEFFASALDLAPQTLDDVLLPGHVVEWRDGHFSIYNVPYILPPHREGIVAVYVLPGLGAAIWRANG